MESRNHEPPNDGSEPARDSRHRVLVAVHVIVEAEATGNVLLLRRKNTGFMDGHLSLPSGHLEADETLVDAAVRELYEETGIVASPAALALHALAHRRYPTREYLHVFFRATAWEGTPHNAEPAKCDGVAFYVMTPPPPDMIPYEREALEAARGSVLVFAHDA